MKVKTKIKSRLLIFILVLITISSTSIIALASNKNANKIKKDKTTEKEMKDEKIMVTSFNGNKIETKIMSKDEWEKEAEIYDEKVSKLPKEKKTELDNWKKKGEERAGSYTRKIQEILGTLPEGSRRITLSEIETLISKYDYDTVVDEMYKIHSIPDFTGGSGITRIMFWLDDEGTEMICIIPHTKQIVYSGNVNQAKILN